MFSTSARQGGTDTTAVTTAKKAGPGAEPHMQYSSSPARFGGPHSKSVGAFHHGFPAAERIWETKPESIRLRGCPGGFAEKRADGVRPILENSTACQKSMPITSSLGCRLHGLWLWVGVLERKSFD